MVVKIQATHTSMAGTLQYNNRKVEQEAARVAGMFNIEGDGLRDAERTFERYERLNRRTDNVSFQMSINPDPDRPGERLTDDEVRDYAMRLMKGLGYGNQPIVIYEHKDIERTHYHVVSIRTNEQGKKIRDYNEQRNLQRMMHDLAQEFHYRVGNEGLEEKSESTKQQPADKVPGGLHFDPTAGDVRKQYADIFDEALTWRFTTFTQFQTVMRSMGVKAEAMEGAEWELVLQGLDGKGKESSHRIQQEELGQDFYNRFLERSAWCREDRPKTKEKRDEAIKERKRVARIVAFCLQLSRSERHLARMLEKKGITMTLSRGVDGTIFGTTFADAKSKTAYKGSGLGEGCALSLFRAADNKETGKWTDDQRLREERSQQHSLDLAALNGMQGDKDRQRPYQYGGHSQDEINEYEELALSALDDILNARESFGKSQSKGPGRKKKKGPRRPRY